jgi:hypothetical protein
MRRLLQQAFFGVHRMLRGFRYARHFGPAEAAETMRVLALCRRALARDGVPAWLVPTQASMPPEQADAVAALNLVLMTLQAVDVAWDHRLIAAGIDPKWPERA